MDNTTFLSHRFGSLWRFSDSGKQYALSQDGRLWRASYAPHKTTTGHKDKLGFHSVNLSKGLEFHGRWYLHRLIYTVWVKPIPENADISHKDQNKSNNQLDNLIVISHAEILLKAAAKGFMKQGLQNQARADAISVLLEANWSHQKIAEAFEITQPAISGYISRHKKVKV
jgi:HNH endonuclease